MNITEFAQYAGVSKAAVSRYFNGGYLSADKRARIEAAVEATGYHPSIQAQMLRTRRTRQVGVILPKLSSDSCPRIVEGIGSVLEESGYQLLLINTANDPQKELRALDTLCRHTVDGILLIATVYTPEHKAVLERMHVPLVVLGQQFPGCCSVYHDDFGAAQAATAHMLAKGTRFAALLRKRVVELHRTVGRSRICCRDGRGQEHLAERPACHKADHLFLIFLIDLPAVVGGDQHLQFFVVKAVGRQQGGGVLPAAPVGQHHIPGALVDGGFLDVVLPVQVGFQHICPVQRHAHGADVHPHPSPAFM